MDKKQLTIYFSDEGELELFEKIREIAYLAKTNMNVIVKEAIKKHLTK